MLSYTACNPVATPKLHGVAFSAPPPAATMATMADKRRNFVKHWRTFKGLTGPEFVDKLAGYADMFGVKLPETTASLSRIENGQQNFSMDFLEAAAAVLATGEDDPTPGDLIARNPFEGMVEVVRFVQDLSPRQQRQAWGVLQAMFAEEQKGYRGEPAEEAEEERK